MNVRGQVEGKRYTEKLKEFDRRKFIKNLRLSDFYIGILLSSQQLQVFLYIFI